MVAETELVIGELAPQTREVWATEEEIKELATSIKREGLKHPITVSNGVVIDGLKRIAAYKLLKLKSIPAFESEDFPELCAHLSKTRPSGPSSMVRAVEIVHDLYPSRELYNTRQRMKAGMARHRAPEERGPRERKVAPRSLLAPAIGFGDNRAEILSQAVRLAMIDPEAVPKLQELRDSKISLNAWQKWNVGRSGKTIAPIVVSADEARSTMERGLRTISTAVEAIGKFGSLSVLTLSERELVIKSMNEARTRLARQVSTIRTEMNQEQQEVEESKDG